MPLKVNKMKCDDPGARLGQLAEDELNRLFQARSVKRILFIAPPDVDANLFDYKTAKRGRYWNYAPYGLGIVASRLRRDGLTAGIINLNNEVLKACRNSRSEENFNFDKVWSIALEKEIQSLKPDIVGVTCMFTQTHKSAVNICNWVRRFRPDLPIAIGGVHITNCFLDDRTSKVLLDDFSGNADMFFLYEAELAFEQFIRAVNRRAPSAELYQVYFNSNTEKLFFSGKRIPGEKELDVIPAHDLMMPAELTDYGVIGGFFCLREKGTKMATVLSNRGCRGQCTYCSVKSFNGRGVRHRSVESVIDELIMLRDKYGIFHVMWLDDDFLHDHKRTLRLFDEMIKRDIGMTWDCTNGVIAASCTDKIIAAAVESGCIGLTVGVESGNPEILRRVRKPGNIAVFLKAAEVLKKYERINTRVFLMIGFPGETYSMILDTFNLASKMDLDWYNITIFEPLPNTKIFESATEEESSSQFEFGGIRYSSGPYGKIREKAKKSQFLSNSENPFRNVNMDDAPSRSELDEIWFYMNFHLNFKRLFKEDRPAKLEQQLKYVRNIVDLIAPEDPFPMYFCGYLQKKVLGRIDEQLIKRLEERLRSSKYWRERFEGYKLSINHLKTGNFSVESKI